MTRKNWIELITASFNKQWEPGWNQFELDTASFNDKENQFWASFNNQEEPVWVSHSQFQLQKQTQFQ